MRFRTPVIMHIVSNYSTSDFSGKAAVYRVVEPSIWIEPYEDVPGLKDENFSKLLRLFSA